MNKTALITDATSKMGQAICRTLAKNGYDVIIIGKSLPEQQKLCIELENKYKVDTYILNFDIRSKHDIFDSYDMLSDSCKSRLSVMINNSSINIGEASFETADDHDWDSMIDINIKGSLYMLQLAAQTMKENGVGGHIINIMSIANRKIYSGGNVFSATQSALDTITQSMRLDLLPYGVRVESLTLGLAENDYNTGRYKGDIEKEDAAFQGIKAITPDDIAEAVEFIVTRPSHVTINDIQLMPTQEYSPSRINRKS